MERTQTKPVGYYSRLTNALDEVIRLTNDPAGRRLFVAYLDRAGRQFCDLTAGELEDMILYIKTRKGDSNA